MTAEAFRLWNELDNDTSRALGVHDRLTNDTRWNRASAAADAGDTAPALHLLPSVIEGRTIRHGADHPWTLACRLEQARRTGRTGRTGEALALATTATTDIRQALGQDHELAPAGRHQQAQWTARRAQPNNAREQFNTLVSACEEAHGPNHPLTEHCKTHTTQPHPEIWHHELPSR
ncbi:hypothetical protein [Streptomyces sp. NPDC002685]|uniref:hypothetical protein n=1 Tax=Streptomyces sp. NPDC002685 TaxID=3154540 RepID=UPI003323F89C